MSLSEFFNTRKEMYSDIESALYDKFEADILIKGNTLLIQLHVAEKFIQKANLKPLAISGIDVFRINNDATTPIDIADYSGYQDESWESFKITAFNASLEFLALQPKLETTYLEFVFVSKDEWNEVDK